jgi:hypothetical protein
MLLASLLGTSLDIYFVKRKLYEFPIRPFPQIFSFNVLFTFVILPAFVIIFLRVMEQLNFWGKAGFWLLVSLLMPVFEKLAELCGFFAHSPKWNHLYSFFGYLTFLFIHYSFYRWLEKLKNEK